MWEPVDTRFMFRRHPVTVVAIGDSGEALLIRALLEQLGAVVHLVWIGTPGDFLEVLREGQTAPYVVISCHGDDNGLCFGEYIPEIDTSMLVKGSLPPVSIAQAIHMPDRVVINTGCYGGSDAMVQAFMAGGLKAYIGATDAPAGTAIPLFIMHFFYQLFEKKATYQAAWEHAAAYDDTSRLFVLHDSDGRHALERSKGGSDQ